jgi:geranylgeranyl pyrophosphate synthase
LSTVAAVLEVPGVSTYLDAVEERLRETVARSGGAVAAAGADTLASGGKRLRPMLVHLCAPPAGRMRPGLVAAGCAVELVHMATLVHDDQIDAAPLRRGRPTVWRSRGPLVSTAAGDHLFARAFSELVTTGDMQAVTILSDACLALARGEILQREQAGNADTTPEQYLERCRLKTGRLFSAATTLGARLGGLPVDETERMGEFGTALGLAFQIADDVLDCDGDPDTTGKALGTDLLDGTVTLPLLLAARRDPDVEGVLRCGAAPADVLPTLARVARSGAVADARREAERHAAAALSALDRLDGRVDVAALSAVVRGAVERRA